MSRPSSPWFRESKGIWYCTMEGKKVSLKVKGRENEKQALQAWHRLFAGMPLETPTLTPEPTIVPQPVPMVKVNGVSVGEVLDAFVADAQERVGKCCIRSYRIWCGRFKADFGHKAAESLTAAKVEAWARKPAWSSSTRHHALGTLATAFKWAERARLIGRSPLVGIRKPPKASRGAKALISHDEHARLVAHADPLFGAYLQMLWLTGARPSEIASLRAEEIDYAQGLVIREQHKEAHLGKSRVIFLSADALAVIKGIGRERATLPSQGRQTNEREVNR